MLLLLGRFTPIFHPGLGSLISWGSERFGGMDLEFADLDTDWTTFLELSQVEIGGQAATHPLKNLTADQLRIDFRLRDLLGGKAEGLRKITARNLVVNAAVEGSQEETPPAPWPKLPPNLPLVDIAPFELHVQLGEGKSIDVLGGNLQVEEASQGEQLRLEATKVAAALPDRSLPTVPLSASLIYREGLAEVEHLALGSLGLSQGSFLDGTELQDQKLRWNLDLLAGQGGGLVAGSLQEGQLSSDFDVRAELQELAQLLPQAASSAGQVSLKGDVSMALSEPEGGTAQITVLGKNLLLQGIPLETAEAELLWRDRRLEIPRLSALDPGHRLNISQLLIPLTGRNPQAWMAEATGQLELEASALHTLLASKGLALESEPPQHQLQLSASLGQGTLQLQDGFLRVEGGALEVRRGEVKLLHSPSGPSATQPSGPVIDLELETSFEDLAPLGQLMGSDSWTGSLEGSLQAQGSWPHLQGTADLVGRQVRVTDFALGDLQLKAQSDGLELKVDSLNAAGDWGTLQASGQLGLKDYHLRNVQMEADVHQAALLQPGAKSPLPIPDQFRLEARLDGPWRQATGSLNLKGSGDLGNLPAEGITLAGELRQGDLEIEAFSLQTPYGEIDAAGTLRDPMGGLPLHLALSQLRLEGQDIQGSKGRNLTLQQPAQLHIGARGARTDGLDLRGSAGALQIRPTFTGSGKDSSEDSGEGPLEMTLEALDPMPFAGSLLPAGWALGDLSGRVLVDWRSKALQLETQGTAGRLRIPAWEQDLVASWQGHLEDGIAQLDNLALKDDRGSFLQLKGQLPFQELLQTLSAAEPPSGPTAGSPLSLQGELQTESFQSVPLQLGGETFELAGNLRGNFQLEGHLHQLLGHLDLEGKEIELRGQAPGGARRLGPGTLDAHVKLDGDDGLTIDELRLDIAEAFLVEASGSVALPADISAYRGSETNPTPWKQAAVEVDGRFQSKDLAWARPWLTDVRRLEGATEGRFEARGTLGAPQLRGVADMTGGSLRLASNGLAVDALEGRVSFDPHRVEVENFGGELGGSPFSLIGSVALAGLSAGKTSAGKTSTGKTSVGVSSASSGDQEDGSAVFDFRLTGENLLLARSTDLRLRSDVDLHLQGPMDALSLSGDLGLRNTRVRQQIDLLGMFAGGVTSGLTGVAAPESSQGGIQLFSFPDPPLSTTRLDLRVRSVDPVQLTGNLAKGGARVDLRIQGTGEVPLPVGTIYLEPTEIRLPSGAAKLSSGTVVFSQGRPFSPEIALGGTTRMQGYDIGIQLTGSVEEPEVLLSSTPPLPNDELLLLVLTGQAPTSTADGLADKRAAESVALYLARDFLVRWMGKGSKQSDSSWLDRFALVRGQDVSENGVETTEASFRLEKGLLHNSDVLYLVAEQDTFEDYNFGLRLVFRFQ